MIITGIRPLAPPEHVWLEQFAEKVPQPFQVAYDTDAFTFSFRLQLNSITTVSEEALTESFADVIPICIQKQLEQMKLEVERLLRDLCGIYELPTVLVRKDQYTKYMNKKEVPNAD